MDFDRKADRAGALAAAPVAGTRCWCGAADLEPLRRARGELERIRGDRIYSFLRAVRGRLGGRRR